MHLKTRYWECTWDRDLTEEEIGGLIDDPLCFFRAMPGPRPTATLDMAHQLAAGLVRTVVFDETGAPPKAPPAAPRPPEEV